MADTNTTGDTVAIVNYKKKVDGDVFSNDAMSEVARRLVVTNEENVEKGLVRSITPPTNQDVIWQPVDEDNVPIGGTMVYDPNTGTWVSTTDTSVIPASPIVNSGVVEMLAAGGTVVVSLINQHANTNYHISLTPTDYDGSAFGATIDASMLFHVSAKTVSTFTITFAAAANNLYLFWRTEG